MRRLLLALAAAGLALLLAGYWGATRDPVVTRYRLALPSLERPLRLVHLSDIHGSPWDMPEARIARIVAQANALRPDIVVITGDFHASKLIDLPMRLEDSLRPLTALKAPLGVWSVPGNHDQPYWTRVVMRRFGLRLLAGTLADVGPVQIAGADDLIMGQDSIAGFRRTAQGAAPGKPLIGLVHEPVLWRHLPANVALLLAGHTHGGQIVGLGDLRMGPFYRQHRRGLFRNRAGQTLIVSAGIGTTWVPLRLGAPAEIVVVELVPQASGRKSGTDR
ncbi:metallophosphoesterase [Sandarakinorhabdus rubra]|uniref:metallophosphoesterase n=1 Tax=Sandarakinorhabdus rubra TaxID=2672568 RepID=UPI0013DA5437|nr:metallophosphoesterase [Sandarakinorhabdus rubra]